MQRYFTLEGKLTLLVVLTLLGAMLLAGAIAEALGELWVGLLVALLAVVPACVYLLHRSVAPMQRLVLGLVDGMRRFKDGDFSVSLAETRRDELGELVRLYNEVGSTLRDERQTLYQRELLLDTVIQTTPLSLVLTNASGRVLYSNTAARQLFAGGRRLEGHGFAELLESAPAALQEAVSHGEDRLFTVELGHENETYHLSHRRFTLNAQQHHLYLFKQLTQEFSRQEVATWKKVIRVISHELNNSLAPMSSLAHSGQLVARNPSPERLKAIFTTIEERADHLKTFIEGYARFAKLPRPRVERVEWPAFLEGLAQTVPFRLGGEPPAQPGFFDPAQVEQVLINLLKNAHESGSDPDGVELAIESDELGVRVRVSDRGSGMTDQVLQSALLPFYSTKRSGTGLGLPLSREIVEAHGGRLSLTTRADGGLTVNLWLPRRMPVERLAGGARGG